MDDCGYVMAGTALLLMIPALIVTAMMLSLSEANSDMKTERTLSASVEGAAWDIRDNIPIITREILNETAWEVINGTIPEGDVRELVRGRVQERVDRLCMSHRNINASCRVNSVEGTEDPFQVEVNSTIEIHGGDIEHAENISVRVTVEGLPDPLPFRVLGRPEHSATSIEYGDALRGYLDSKGVDGEAYVNATGPLIIRRCPYEPYSCHGLEGLHACILNGYYHESRDGACYLCRLEGKTSCPHMGLETFIIPSVDVGEAPVSIDHVLFNETYNGEALNISGFIIYLDGGHRTKYGVETP
ncbi:hypothetical protein DNK57_04220 [Methanothermobacter thermautotrophicus]|uniref:Uncharacterized protein n=1 Tax=Methanothermobacter thermautotrophicus TaxID=145262 RepID=A0A842YKI2_METTF|nr:hypothetical protein [Methanothermobacter thermautotrophicus]MBE2900022.1 hypothetical protein [Methanothermobacter thermautotrophicus]